MIRIPHPGGKFAKGMGRAIEMVNIKENIPMIRSQACTLI
jgi:hypothetical protein